LEETDRGVLKRTVEEQEQIIHDIEKQLDEELNNSKQNLAISDEQVQIFKSEIEDKKKVINGLMEDLSTYKSKNQELEEIVRGLEEKIKKIEEEYQQKEKELADANIKIEKNKELIETSIKKEYEEQVGRQTRTIKKQKEEIASLTEQVNELKNQVNSLEEKNGSLKDLIENLKDKLESNKSAILEKTDQVLDLKDEIKQLNETVNALREKLELSEKKDFKYIQGREQILESMNEALGNARMRVLLIIPTIKDLEGLNLSILSDRVNVRVATSIEKTEEDQDILNSFKGRSNFTFRNFSRKDRWGLEFDREGLIIATNSEKAGPVGFYITEYKQIEFYLTLLSEAWVQGHPL